MSEISSDCSTMSLNRTSLNHKYL